MDSDGEDDYSKIKFWQKKHRKVKQLYLQAEQVELKTYY